MTANQITDLVGKNRITRYSICPGCQRKGLYNVNRRYYRCRYCGHYRIILPGATST